MKTLLTLLFACVALDARAQNLPQVYAKYGELIVTPFASAPFPHPQRADGHKYKDQLFPADKHYQDSTVAIFIPKGFRETGRIDFVIHFHGWKNHVESVLRQFKLIEQLAESGRNAVLVVPQGPRDASDSFGGKLEDPDGFKRFMDEVMTTLRQKSSLQKKDANIGRIVLSGHSGGYRVISAILDRGGLSDPVDEVWLFDALYAETEKFHAWFDKQHGRLINIYTEHGGTKDDTEKMMADLKQRGTAFFAGKETEAETTDLRTNKLIFLYTELGHNEVLDQHWTFRQFLKTSCLGEITAPAKP